MQKHILTVTAAGTTGAASGSDTVVLTHAGTIYGAYLDVATNVTTDTCIRLEALSPTKAMFVLTGVSAASADGWYFPRAVANTYTGTSYTSTIGLLEYPVIGTLALRVGSSTPTANAAIAYVFVNEL